MSTITEHLPSPSFTKKGSLAASMVAAASSEPAPVVKLSPLTIPAVRTASSSPTSSSPISAFPTEDRGLPKAVDSLPDLLSSSSADTLPQARFVTASAILSRSGACIPLQPEPSNSFSFGPDWEAGDDASGSQQRSGRTRVSHRHQAKRRRSIGSGGIAPARQSNGSALEAFGALLLHRDSAGKVSNLSFRRADTGSPSASEEDGGDERENSIASRGRKSERKDGPGRRRPVGHGLSQWVSQDWLERVREASSASLGLTFPGRSAGSAQPTIAERRARRLVSEGTGSVADADSFLVRSRRRGQPTFELSMPQKRPLLPHRRTVTQLFDFVNQRREGPITGGQLPTPSTPNAPDKVSHHSPRLPNHTRLLLKRSRTEHPLSSDSAPRFSIGSLPPNLLDLPDAPPSPLAMPGAWAGSSNRKRKGPGAVLDDMYEEGALLLPPPLLDDHGSDPTSFEGLLGIRRMREQEQRRQELERLRLRNRPAHKVGMMTALSNFIKAAHAAERSAKGRKQTLGVQSLRRPDGPKRRHTEPGPPAEDHLRSAKAKSTLLSPLPPPHTHSREPSLDDMDDLDLGSSVGSSPRFRAAHGLGSAAASRAASIETAGRLDTVFETEAAERVNRRAESVSGESSTSHSPRIKSVRSSRDNSRSSIQSLRDLPRAPRLLPVHISRPPSPFTPLQTSDDMGSSPGSYAQDYLSSRRIEVAPATPRLGPTMLSLPPSPWTSLGNSYAAQPPWDVRLQLQSRRGSIEPGTPRLVPTYVDVAPSPLATPSISNGFRLTSSSPYLGSVDSSFIEDEIGREAGAGLVGSLSKDAASSSQISPLLRQRHRRSTTQDSLLPGHGRASSSSPARLTPSELIASTAASSLGPRVDSYSTPLPAPRISGAALPPSGAHCHASEPSGVRETGPSAKTDDDRTQGRNWFVWFLVGDLGLRSRKAATPASEDTLGLGGVAGLAMHLCGFIIFVGAHLVALLYDMYENAALAFWFVRWMWQNLTGRTVLAQCIIEAHRLIRKEWETVAREDHEDRGNRRRRKRTRALASVSGSGRRGSAVSIGSETAGEEDEGDEVQSVPRGLSRWQVVRGLVELACIHNVTRERYLREGAGLEKLEGWRRRPRPDRSQSQDNADFGEEDEEEDGEDEDEGGEMYVTRKGADILELAKTPAPRPTKNRTQSGYFEEDGFGGKPQPIKKASLESRRENATWSKDPHALVKTIKWASRLAISAYGLHVHIVDLPPTFTPSGERFSRQTFAHLSRLNADDVLHAEIQSLDAEAVYSPTFYIVRDYARQVVVVAIRGTQSFQDIIVDLDIDTEHVELPSVEGVPGLEQAEGGGEQRCHAGIIRAAQALLEPDSSLFCALRDALEQDSALGVVFTGHSLGGAIASSVAMLLSTYVVPSGAAPEEGEWRTHADSGLPAGRRVRALSFAHPATMSSALANRCSLGEVPLVTSVVLGSDIIPRTGHGQAREMRRVLGALARVRRRHAMRGGDDGEGSEGDARVHVVRSWWDWRSIGSSDRPDEAMVHRREHIEEQLWRVRCDVEADLYAAVKSRAMAAARDRNVPPSPWVGPSTTGPMLHQLATRRQNLEARTVSNEEASGGVLVPAGRCMWVKDGEVYDVTSPLSFFGLPDLHPALFAEHFPSAYESALEELPT